MILEIDKKFLNTFSDRSNLFDQIMAIDGEIYRKLEGRRTLRFTRNRKNYFIKQHYGVGWKEICKNIFQLRFPILSAKNEWQAIQKLSSLQIPTLKIIAYGKRGLLPARMQSFIITEELTEIISLEDFCAKWRSHKPSFSLKQKIITELATISRKIHSHGMNHRDFYLCHFLLNQKFTKNEPIILYLIDLHRAEIRNTIPYRWRVKDIAGLYFSSMDIGLTERDLLRFLQSYFMRPWREIVENQTSFLHDVENRAVSLYKKTFNKSPPCKHT